MGKQQVYMVVILDALDERELARLMQELRELGLAPTNGHGGRQQTPGRSETQQGREP